MVIPKKCQDSAALPVSENAVKRAEPAMRQQLPGSLRIQYPPHAVCIGNG